MSPCFSRSPTFKDRLCVLMRFLCSVALLGLTSCAAIKRSRLKDTEIFYRAETPTVYPTKASNAPIPVLYKRPPKSTVIGHFQFGTLKGSAFALEAAVHNARRAGADAIVVRDLRDWIQPYSYFLPAEVVQVPRTRMISVPVWRPGPAGMTGHWETECHFETFFLMEHRPGRHVSGSHTHSVIDAEMIQTKPSAP